MNEALDFEVRSAIASDRAFLVEMAREACALEGRHPLPLADDPTVVGLLPGSDDAVVVAERDGRPLGAAWWLSHDPPLVSDGDDELPEMAMAVVKEHRGAGIGGALVEALAARASVRFPALTLNVHLLNHAAVGLYVRTGFHVAGAGRGRFGVAMIRPLPRPTDARG